MKKRYILIIGDGMADNPVPSLGGKTPLQAAAIPNIDRLAALGETGTVRTIPAGVPAGSDTGILSIFSYNPLKYYTGRSPLEAAGVGIKLAPGSISYRCNMVSLSDGAPYTARKILSHNGGGVEGAQSIGLMKYLLSFESFAAAARESGISFNLFPSFRHIAVSRPADIDGISLTPPHDILGQPIEKHLPKGPGSGPLYELMQQATDLLDDAPINKIRREKGLLPANGIWFWAEGRVANLPNFYKKFTKISSSAVISAVPLVTGIGALAGIPSLTVEGATGELETNYEGKAAAALGALRGGADFAVIHVEAPDECTHMGDTVGKIKAIENIDSRVLAPLLAGLEKDNLEKSIPFAVLILADHKTLTSTRTHDGEPVPFLIYDSEAPAGCGRPYDEESGLKGEFIEDGSTILSRLFSK